MYVNYVNSCFTLIYIIKHGMCSMQDYTLCDNQRENKGSLRWHKFGLLIVQFSIWTLEKNLAWISLVLSLSVLNFSILNSLCTLLDYTSFFGVLFYLSKQQTANSDVCLTSYYNVMPWITCLGHENKGNDHLLDKLLIIKQILLDSTTGCLWRTVRRLCILILGCKGLP